MNKKFLQLSKFGAVGLSATATHVSIFFTLRFFAFGEQLSNFIAFLFAFTISWAGHYFWTFRNAKQSGRTQSLVRFLCVAGLGYGLNSFWVFLIITTYQQPDFYAVLCMLSLTPLNTFLLSKFWAFRS